MQKRNSSRRKHIDSLFQKLPASSPFSNNKSEIKEAHWNFWKLFSYKTLLLLLWYLFDVFGHSIDSIFNCTYTIYSRRISICNVKAMCVCVCVMWYVYNNETKKERHSHLITNPKRNKTKKERKLKKMPTSNWLHWTSWRGQQIFLRHLFSPFNRRTRSNDWRISFLSDRCRCTF